jgi:REP element-mobilizing transposase RayT
MPRIPRFDAAGSWHHVMNRGIARRTLFENQLDIRTFLSRLALRVRAGHVEVHAFCVMTTHYHLLLRSVTGELSAAMCEVHREYSRWFNRSRHRDGPLFRGRFVSKPVDDLDYRLELVRYIDFNPVSAGLVVTPALYPHGSARHYANPRGPIWLDRTWVEETVTRRRRVRRYDPEDYAHVFGEAPSRDLEQLIEKRLAVRGEAHDPLSHLIGAAHGQVREWMEYKARLADGLPVGMPVCDPEALLDVIAEGRRRLGGRTVQVSRKSVSIWPQLSAALLRDLAGLSWDEVSRRLGTSATGAWRMHRRHDRCVIGDAEYSACVADFIRAAMQRTHGGWMDSNR